jgi:hypothetical protein
LQVTGPSQAGTIQEQVPRKKRHNNEPSRRSQATHLFPSPEPQSPHERPCKRGRPRLNRPSPIDAVQNMLEHAGGGPLTSSGSERNRLDASGNNETGFLDPLREVVASGKTPAALLLEKYHGEWGGDVSYVYDEMSF